MVGGLQGEEWKFIQKYLKKNIPKCRSQISGSTKDHFAGEKWCLRDFADTQEGCEIFSHQQAGSAPLRSWLSSCGVWLPSRRETLREIQSTVQKGCEILATKG